MTGSGKTGLGIALLEEAAIDGIPVIAIDPKGDLGNLLLTFPGSRRKIFSHGSIPTKQSGEGSDRAICGADGRAVAKGLASWDQSGERIERLVRQSTWLSILTRQHRRSSTDSTAPFDVPPAV